MVLLDIVYRVPRAACTVPTRITAYSAMRRICTLIEDCAKSAVLNAKLATGLDLSASSAKMAPGLSRENAVARENYFVVKVIL